MNQSLNNGMICGIHMAVERKRTFPLTKISVIGIRSDYPVLPEKKHKFVGNSVKMYGAVENRNYVFSYDLSSQKFREIKSSKITHSVL